MMNVDERPDTLDDTIQELNPDQNVHCSRHTDGDVYIDNHDRARFYRNAASQERSPLYSENWAHVGSWDWPWR